MSYLTFYGGAGEIGGNKILLETGKAILKGAAESGVDVSDKNEKEIQEMLRRGMTKRKIDNQLYLIKVLPYKRGHVE